jgi:hypothetical protein
MQLEYRFKAAFTDSVQIGPVPAGVRVDNYFDGAMTEGELTGARVRGVDQITIRGDGSVELDIREIIETEQGAISADVRGYALPHPDVPTLHAITGYALFTTAVPAYAAYNDAVLAIEGTVDMATGQIDVEGRPFEPRGAQRRLEQLERAV